MALITKPDMEFIWASGGAVVKPSDVKIQTGWTPEVPPHQWENWIQKRQDEYLAHINQRGIPEWDGNTEYEASGLSYVQGGDGVVYKSVAASGPSTTVQDPTTDVTDTYWIVAFANPGDFLTKAANLNDLANKSTARTNLGVQNAVEAGIRGSHSNLKASSTGLSAVVTVTADAVCLKNASNEQVVLNAVSVTPSFANAGVNGLDVGAGGSQSASTWYYVHVIWNGTTVAGLLSLSDTAPTLPSGYTHFALASAVRTDATANKFPFPYDQKGERVQWAPASGSNMTLFPTMASTTATLAATAIAVANHAPGRAGAVIVRLRTVCNSGTYFTAYVGASTFLPFISGASSPVGVQEQLLQATINLQSTNIAWTTTVLGAGAASVESEGFILNL